LFVFSAVRACYVQLIKLEANKGGCGAAKKSNMVRLYRRKTPINLAQSRGRHLHECDSNQSAFHTRELSLPVIRPTSFQDWNLQQI